jgi:hypothetical protein
MNVGLVIVLAALCFKMMLLLGNQFVGLIASQASDAFGHESFVAILAVTNGLGMIVNLALAIGCGALAADKRALPFGVLGALGWGACVVAAGLSTFLNVHHELLVVVWIAAYVGALTLTVAGAEAIRGEIRGLWVGAVGVAALVADAAPPLVMRFLGKTHGYEVARGVYFLGAIASITLLIVIVVVTIVPALSPAPSPHRR